MSSQPPGIIRNKNKRYPIHPENSHVPINNIPIISKSVEIPYNSSNYGLSNDGQKTYQPHQMNNSTHHNYKKNYPFDQINNPIIQPKLTSYGFDGNSVNPSLYPNNTSTSSQINRSNQYENEPPLLEELGINLQHIKKKTISVLIPKKKIDQSILEDTDMAGPLVFCLIQGFLLIFHGKFFFGYVFGFAVLGSISMYLIINLMNHYNTNIISIFSVFSILGYCILPIVILSFLIIFIDTKTNPWLSVFLTAAAVLRCTQTSTHFFETASQMHEQYYLIAYPTFLLYASFALLTVF